NDIDLICFNVLFYFFCSGLYSQKTSQRSYRLSIYLLCGVMNSHFFSYFLDACGTVLVCPSELHDMKPDVFPFADFLKNRHKLSFHIGSLRHIPGDKEEVFHDFSEYRFSKFSMYFSMVKRSLTSSNPFTPIAFRLSSSSNKICSNFSTKSSMEFGSNNQPFSP